MALIINADMPKACNWFDENGKHRFCKVNAFCDCRIYARGKRPSDCPILGEIPDKHGDLIDRDYLKHHLEACETNGRPLHRMELQERLECIDDVPVVLERTT